MQDIKELQHGKLLIAEPYMMDGYFKRAVVLITDYNKEEGTVGFILNRKTQLKMHELIDDFPEFHAPVFYGGPVANGSIHYLHRCGDLLEGSTEVLNGVYWGGDFLKLKFLVETKVIKEQDIRFYIGYSGWSEGQLEEEMETGSWIVGRGDINYIFSAKASRLWSTVLKHKGNNYGVIGDMPDNISLN
jgi:putative transcriptional regulator